MRDVVSSRERRAGIGTVLGRCRLRVPALFTTIMGPSDPRKENQTMSRSDRIELSSAETVWVRSLLDQRPELTPADEAQIAEQLLAHIQADLNESASYIVARLAAQARAGQPVQPVQVPAQAPEAPVAAPVAQPLQPEAPAQSAPEAPVAPQE